MSTHPSQLRDHLRQHGQEHVLAWWDDLTPSERQSLLNHLHALELDQLRRLYEQRANTCAVPDAHRIQPAPMIRLDGDTESARRLGEELLSGGKVAVLCVAGGQGSRLGFEQPKGMYPVGPISGKSLFQIHAEKVLALRRRHGRPIPFLVMTSDATHADTVAFFREHHHFGLPAGEVLFFRQGTMPALDLETGRLLMEAPGRLCTSPNGHGGTLTALAETGLLAELRTLGIEEIFYFQVDNPLAKVADPVFLGHHRAARAEASTKVVPKLGPVDKMGNVVAVEGRCAIIEYSDLPEELAQATDEHGRLRISAGNTAIHLFNVEFLTRVTAEASNLPFHLARKKVPYLDETGRLVQPERENALKFERFIFDVLPLAERWTVVETSRREEFEPLKNADGPNSPATVREAIRDLAADWLTRAGVIVPPSATVEISPLFALDAAELSEKVDKNLGIDGLKYLDPASPV